MTGGDTHHYTIEDYLFSGEIKQGMVLEALLLPSLRLFLVNLACPMWKREACKLVDCFEELPEI